LVVAGGVAANRRLRVAFDTAGLEVSFPPPGLATDNGAMIALAASRHLHTLRGESPPIGSATADAVPYQPLAGAPA
jgi:N6-L-threonylcarbamoyladenine synthase